MKRPYTTIYDSGSSQGAAASPEGAVRATVVRIFIGQYRKAEVVDRRTGVTVYTVLLNGRQLKVLYGGT